MCFGGASSRTTKKKHSSKLYLTIILAIIYIYTVGSVTNEYMSNINDVAGQGSSLKNQLKTVN